MKNIISNSKFVIFAFGLVIIFAFISCQTASLGKLGNDVIVSDTNIKINQNTENSMPENGEDECLRAEYPKQTKYPIISAGVLNGKAVDIPKPEYPEEAKAKNIDGEVIANIYIDETGNIIWAKVDNGHPLLQNAVKKVVCKATFKPTTISENPVSVRGIITYKFVRP